MPSQDSRNEEIVPALQTIADKQCEKRLAGIAIGVIVDGREYSSLAGSADEASGEPITESTIFEIGSISKLFTSLMLAIAANKQEVDLDAPVQSTLSELVGDVVTLPADGESEITFRSLANHRSSLPRLPDDLIKTADMENPYFHYDQEMLYACLSRMDSIEPIGSKEEYSNFAVGLLGHVLGKAANSDYLQTLKKRVLVPLGMLATSTETDSEQAERLATVHRKKGTPVRHWDFSDVTVGAGGIRSSISDMLKFLRANVFPNESCLSSELALMREPSELPIDPAKSADDSDKDYRLSTKWLGAGFFAVLSWQLQWFFQVGPGSWVFILIFFYPIYFSGSFYGFAFGCLTAALNVTMTSWLWGIEFNWISNLFVGAVLAYLGSQWSSSAFELPRSKGRLAWQETEIDSHEVLWHNGMVGGSASYLGVIPSLELGVVVLTNTAKSVDGVGTKVLRELIELKKKQQVPS